MKRQRPFLSLLALELSIIFVSATNLAEQSATDCALTVAQSDAQSLLYLNDSVSLTFTLSETAEVVITTCESEFDTQFSLILNNEEVIGLFDDNNCGVPADYQFNEEVAITLQPGAYEIVAGAATTQNYGHKFSLRVELSDGCSQDSRGGWNWIPIVVIIGSLVTLGAIAIIWGGTDGIKLILWHTVGFGWLDVLQRCVFILFVSLFCQWAEARNHVVILIYVLNPIGKRLVRTEGGVESKNSGDFSCASYLILLFPVAVIYGVIQFIALLFLGLIHTIGVRGIVECKSSYIDVFSGCGTIKIISEEEQSAESTTQKMEQNNDLEALKIDAEEDGQQDAINNEA